MFREKIPIRTIQLLLGHASVQTTKIYLKELIPETVRPNETVANSQYERIRLCEANS